MTLVQVLATVIGAYLLGSIPFGLLLTRSGGLGDIRDIGSGNIGATNVLRTGNRKLAVITLVLDMAKGASAVLLFAALDWHPWAPLLAGLAVFLGHCFPLWLKFNGGKGVATFFGIILALQWPIGLLATLTWALIAATTRYSSLAALVTVTAVPVFFWQFGGADVVAFSIVLTVLVFARHAENIQRLIAGTESKIGGSKPADLPKE